MRQSQMIPIIIAEQGHPVGLSAYLRLVIEYARAERTCSKLTALFKLAQQQL